MVRVGGRWDRGSDVGRWDGASDEMPASILFTSVISGESAVLHVNTYLLASERRPLRMYSAGTSASSGAAAMIASRGTSEKRGRSSLRGSCTLGEAGRGGAWR